MDRKSGLWTTLSSFCKSSHFRSATVDELILGDDFFRRPVRPEDLEFLKFDRPIRAEEFAGLSSLMSHRTLLSLNERGEARLPQRRDAASIASWRSFYRVQNDSCIEAVCRQLETHVFGFLDGDRPEDPISIDPAHAFDLSFAYWRDQKRRLEQSGYDREGLTFIMIQHVPLASSVGAHRLPDEIAHVIAGSRPKETAIVLDGLFDSLEMRAGRHPYWQFYLPGSLAAVNLLHRYARSPLTIGEYAGARLSYEADRLALRAVFAETGPALAERFHHDLKATDSALASLLKDRIGDDGPTGAARGAGQMGRLLDMAHRELSEQLTWISNLGWSKRAAAEISALLDREVRQIDRETFIEPREMCSTTHVHDDHRLVVIESGRMRFWGNASGFHDMGPGDMILVPKHRLHGSTVLSEQCVYHQPIIPDEWKRQIPSWSAQV